MSILHSPIQFSYPKNQLLAKLETAFVYWGGCSIIDHLYPERGANQKYGLWEYIMSHIGLLASQRKVPPLAGPLSLIFSSTKVTASEESKTYAGVTVSMTSEDSAGYANLSSPESGSAKYRQHRSLKPEVTVTSRNAINGLACAHVVGGCPDNLLNIKAESAFVQAVDIAQTLCVTISNSQNQRYEATACIQGVHSPKGHIASAIPEMCSALSLSFSSRPVQSNEIRCLEDVLVTKKKKGSIRSATLWHCEEVDQVFGNFLFSALSLRPQASITHDEKLALGFSVFSHSTQESISSIRSWGNRICLACDLLFLFPVAIINLAFTCGGVSTKYSNYGQKKSIDMWLHLVLFCSHTLIASWCGNSKAHKDGYPIWASNHNVKEAYTMAFLHGTQTRPKFTDTYWIVPCYETTPYGKVSFTRQDRRIFISMFKDSRLIWAGRQPVNGFTQGLKDPKSQKVGVKHTMSHEGIEEISIPQGGVNITPPSTPTITNIVTVPTTVSDIATVQGVAHV